MAGFEFFQRQFFDEAFAGGLCVQILIVKDDKVLVPGDANVDFDPIGFGIDGGFEGAPRVADELVGRACRGKSGSSMPHDQGVLFLKSGTGFVVPLKMCQQGKSLMG